MEKYTVTLIVPDYISSSWPSFYTTLVEAISPTLAAEIAKGEASAEHNGDAEDYCCVEVFKGHHEVLYTEV